MRIEADTVEEYIEALPEDRKDVIIKLRQTILANLPEGFEERIQYCMPSYVVPHEVYPGGYHVKPEDPLPFMSIASQKNHVAVYHAGVYADQDMLEWFQSEYSSRVPKKLDMGKSCIRFKKLDMIPYDLIGELAGRMTPAEWIAIYEKNVKR
ncbi:MAG: DUF1801 domain-containing protein [Rhodothermales bacterium]|nr:DUF1801 domain-containing protein [Rhodothermales bacterium]